MMHKYSLQLLLLCLNNSSRWHRDRPHVVRCGRQHLCSIVCATAAQGETSQSESFQAQFNEAHGLTVFGGTHLDPYLVAAQTPFWGHVKA